MNTRKDQKGSRSSYNLGELIMAVSSYSRSNNETVAAVADLLESGRVRLLTKGHKIKARIC